MESRKNIAAAVLGILAVISLGRGIVVSSRPRAGAALHQDAIKEEQQRTVKTETETGPAGKRRTVYAAWGRNPFSKSVSRSTVLTGIIWNEDHPHAIVAGELVEEGDTVNGAEVVKIRKNSVVLNDGCRDFELMIEY